MGLFNRSSRGATAGLVGLLALNVVLVAWALKSNDATPIDSASSSIDSASASPSATPSSTPSPAPSNSASPTPSATATATGTPTATAPAAPLQTILVALDNRRAWRITVGSCAAGGAKIVTTADGGATWADAQTPLGTIVRVRPTDGQTAFVVGADTSCAAELKNTNDAGATWNSGSAVGSAWFRDPKNPAAVRAPGSATSAPCGRRAVLDLAVLSVQSARVLCADGLVRSTTDTGSSWTDSGKASGAVALAVLPATPTQTYVALLDAPGCTGVQVEQVGQSATSSCVATPLPEDPGQIALSLVAGGGWLSVGDATMRSTDKLVTWNTS